MITAWTEISHLLTHSVDSVVQPFVLSSHCLFFLHIPCTPLIILFPMCFLNVRSLNVHTRILIHHSNPKVYLGIQLVGFFLTFPSVMSSSYEIPTHICRISVFCNMFPYFISLHCSIYLCALSFQCVRWLTSCARSIFVCVCDTHCMSQLSFSPREPYSHGPKYAQLTLCKFSHAKLYNWASKKM